MTTTMASQFTSELGASTPGSVIGERVLKSESVV